MKAATRATASTTTTWRRDAQDADVPPGRDRGVPCRRCSRRPRSWRADESARDGAVARPGRSVSGSPVGRRVQQPAVGPQRVEAALEREGRPRPEVAVVDLAVVPDGGDHVDHPVRLEASRVERAPARPPRRDAARRRCTRVLVLRRDSATLACVMPSSSASIVANTTHLTMLNHWSSPSGATGPSGSLRHDLVEDDVVVRVGERGPPRDELRAVAGDRVAAALLVGRVGRVDLRERRAAR